MPKCSRYSVLVITVFLSMTLTLFVMAIPNKQASTSVTSSSAATDWTNPTTSTTRQKQYQQQYGNQWWIYRLRQQQKKLLQQQERFLKQLRQNSSSSDNTNLNNQTTVTTSVIQIVETEYMDEFTGQWTALQNGTYCSNSRTDDVNDAEAMDDTSIDPTLQQQRNPKRGDVHMVPQWTDAMTGQPVVAPSEYELYNQSNQIQTWIGEWKIAVTSTSQSGWEYSRRRRPKQTLQQPQRRSSPLLQYTHRQRIWLRTVATTTIDNGDMGTQPSPIKVLKRKKYRKRKSTNFYDRIVTKVQEDWNFKGFGVTFVKSILYRNAFGIAFRLPVTLHFKTWERYPALPNIGSSIAIFFPQLCICLFINLSLRVEYIQLTLYYISHIVPSLCTAVLLLLLRGLALAVSALLYPLTRQPLLLATIQEYDDQMKERNTWWDLLLPINNRPPPYQQRRHPESDERIDVSWSFRWSLDHGYEFRTTCSHFYAIPLAAVMEAMIPLLPLSDNKRTVYSTTSIMKMMDWIPRHEAAIGCSFVGPAYHDKTGLFITANTLLALSGIYSTEHPKIRNGWKKIAEASAIQPSRDFGTISNSGSDNRSKVADQTKTTKKSQMDNDDSSLELDRVQGNATNIHTSKTAATLTNTKVMSN